MCFSASASFGLGAVCVTVGVATLQRAREPDLMIAALPLLLGAHQMIEGVVWVTHAQGLGFVAAYAFIIVAVCFWPLYLPLAVWLSETDPRRRRIIVVLGAAGLFLDANAAITLAQGVDVDFASHHIAYELRAPRLIVFDYIYLGCAVAPLFVHSSAYMMAFGVLALLFFALSVVYFTPARYSVWCFFGALSSAIVWFFVTSRGAVRAGQTRRPETRFLFRAMQFAGPVRRESNEHAIAAHATRANREGARTR